MLLRYNSKLIVPFLESNLFPSILISVAYNINHRFAPKVVQLSPVRPFLDGFPWIRHGRIVTKFIVYSIPLFTKHCLHVCWTLHKSSQLISTGYCSLVPRHNRAQQGAALSLLGEELWGDTNNLSNNLPSNLSHISYTSTKMVLV